MMGFFSNLFAKQNCAVCGKECGTLHRSKLRDGQFLCDDCGDKCGWEPEDPAHPPKFCPECGDPFDDSDRT